jgi:trehalose/maltose transport system permease protein
VAVVATARRVNLESGASRWRAFSRTVGNVLFGVVVLIILLYTLFPFYWAVASSLKGPQELFVTPQTLWPEALTLENYRSVFGNRDFLRAMLNSTIVAGSAVLLSMTVGAFASFALGRIEFRGRTVLLYLMLSMTMFPAIAILGSLFQMVRTFGIYNSYLALILPYLTFTLPFTIWVLTNFFRAIPRDLEDAALIDGATPMQAFFQVLLPLTAPGLVTTGLLAFIGAWNELLFALTFTLDASARTVPVAITQFSGSSEFELPWGPIMAASVTVTVPLIVLVLLLQRRIIAGLTAGAIKG